MKSTETKKSIEDFNSQQIKEEQIDAIKGGQAAIIINDAEGI